MERYSNATSASTSTLTATGARAQSEPQRQREVPAKLELIDKLLHELHEESIGMNGTFNVALSPVTPAAGGNTAESKSAYASGLGETLDSFAARVQQVIHVLRDVRSRCEL